jgi:hypothetical protein
MPIEQPLLVVTVIMGLMTAVAGYHLHRLFIELLGLLTGAVVWYTGFHFGLIGGGSGMLLPILSLLAAIVGGVLLALWMHKAVISILGSMTATMTASLLVGIDSQGLFDPGIMAISTIGAILAWKLHRTAVIFSSAVIGAGLTATGAPLLMDPETTLSSLGPDTLSIPLFAGVAIGGIVTQGIFLYRAHEEDEDG